MRKLYYAVGGGMGHLARAQAMAHTLGWTREEVLFVSASPYAAKVLEGWHHCSIPLALAAQPLALRTWLQDLLERTSIREIYLDTFPVGLWGEWNGPWASEYAFFGVFRYLNWANYQSWITKPPHFRQSFQVETLATSFREFVRRHSQQSSFLALQYPAVPLAPPQLEELERLASPLWLIVHSRPAEEVAALLEMAQDQARLEGLQPTLLVLTQEKITDPTVICRDWGNAQACFRYVDRIFTGAGFNLMQQTRPFRDKHHCLPFIRRYDDQFWRRNSTYHSSP